jgi:hypothetical protein
VITGSVDGAARLWEVAGYRERISSMQRIDELLAEARGRIDRQLTDEERRQLLLQ